MKARKTQRIMCLTISSLISCLIVSSTFLPGAMSQYQGQYQDQYGGSYQYGSGYPGGTRYPYDRYGNRYSGMSYPSSYQSGGYYPGSGGYDPANPYNTNCESSSMYQFLLTLWPDLIFTFPSHKHTLLLISDSWNRGVCDAWQISGSLSLESRVTHLTSQFLVNSDTCFPALHPLFFHMMKKTTRFASHSNSSRVYESLHLIPA